jgi:agmatinase
MLNKPICYVPDRKIPEIYSGVPTFLGLPKIQDKKDIANSDVVVMGVPWEGVCTYGGFSGCELAPKAIRAASVRYGGYMPDYDIDVFDCLSGADYGDCAVQNGDQEFSFAQMKKKLGDILEYGKMPIAFGGDHSISYPLISEFAKKHNGNIGIIHFDAHMDNVAAYGEENFARCSPFYRLYEDPGVNAKKIVHFGIRGPRNHPDVLKSAKKFGATVMTALQIKAAGIKDAIKRAIDIAGNGTEAVYITVCSDVLDVANNPAGAPDPCGLTSFEMACALNECGKAKADAFDFVEIYPPQDPKNISSHTAVWLTLHLLAGIAAGKAGKAALP